MLACVCCVPSRHWAAVGVWTPPLLTVTECCPLKGDGWTAARRRRRMTGSGRSHWLPSGQSNQELQRERWRGQWEPRVWAWALECVCVCVCVLTSGSVRCRWKLGLQHRLLHHTDAVVVHDVLKLVKDILGPHTLERKYPWEEKSEVWMTTICVKKYRLRYQNVIKWDYTSISRCNLNAERILKHHWLAAVFMCSTEMSVIGYSDHPFMLFTFESVYQWIRLWADILDIHW